MINTVCSNEQTQSNQSLQRSNIMEKTKKELELDKKLKKAFEKDTSHTRSLSENE